MELLLITYLLYTVNNAYVNNAIYLGNKSVIDTLVHTNVLVLFYS